MATKKKPLLTTDEVAAILDVPSQRLRRWRMEGAGPKFIRINRRCIRYRPEDLDAWLDGNAFDSTAQYTR